MYHTAVGKYCIFFQTRKKLQPTNILCHDCDEDIYENRMCFTSENVKMLKFSLFFQINIFGHVVGAITGNGNFELLSLRLSVTNSIVDPWIYIVFRKDTIDFLQHKVVNQIFPSREAPSSSVTNSTQFHSDSPVSPVLQVVSQITETK